MFSVKSYEPGFPELGSNTTACNQYEHNLQACAVFIFLDNGATDILGLKSAAVAADGTQECLVLGSL